MNQATRRISLFATAAALAFSIAGGCKVEKNVRPTIRFTSPADGSTINSNSVILSIAVTGFTLDPGPDTGTPFRGRWHLYIDNQPGVAVVATNVAISEIPAGEHHFFAELANQNDVPVSGVPVDELVLTFPASAPSLLLTAPAPGATIQSSSVDAALSVANFTLDSANIGAANIPGHAHYRVFFDSLDAPLHDEGATPVFTVTDLPASGNVEIWFALANDDETLLDPPVFDERFLTIGAGAPGVTILSPAANAVVGSTFSVAVEPRNFAFVNFAGAPADSAGQGHYDVLVDGSNLGPSFLTTSNGWSSRGPGAHEVRVELRTNTGAALAPPVVDKVRVTVP